MKYIFVFLTFVISINSTAQSKKEQIAILTARLDSLNKEYVKDTTYLSNTVETINREYTIITMQYDEAREQLQKKSATITDKSNTIKSLHAKNMELMQEMKSLRQKNIILNDSLKLSKKLQVANKLEDIVFPKSLVGSMWSEDCGNAEMGYDIPRLGFRSRPVEKKYEGIVNAVFIYGYEWEGEVIKTESNSARNIFKIYYLIDSEMDGYEGLGVIEFSIDGDNLIFSEQVWGKC
jgi:predicted nuclease with TOPRIM domain